MGYSLDPNDPKPKFDYKIRGIVKAALKNAVIFWESPELLLKNEDNFHALLFCLDQLLKRKLVTKRTIVHGSGIVGKTSIGTLKKLL